MAKKKTEEPKEEKGAKDDTKGTPEKSGGSDEGAENLEASKKKRKLILIAGIGGVGLAAASVGGFFVMKTMSAPHDMKAQQLPDPAAGETKDSKSEDKGKAAEHKEDEGQSKDSKATSSPGSDEKPKAKEEANEQGSKDSKEKSADPNAAAEGGKETKHDGNSEGSADQNTFGDTIDIPKMELNLGNPLENRFLRFGLSIEYHGGEDQKNALSRRMPQIRDVVITMISKKSRIELLSSNGKEAFRKQLKNSLNELLDKPISNVYFTEFLVE